MAKQISPKSKPPERRRWEYYTSGAGHTSRMEQTMNRDVPLAQRDIEVAHINMAFSEQSPFDWYLSEIKDKGIQTLKHAGVQDGDLEEKTLELVEGAAFIRGKMSSGTGRTG
jgi:hypothetical protein